MSRKAAILTCIAAPLVLACGIAVSQEPAPVPPAQPEEIAPAPATPDQPVAIPTNVQPPAPAAAPEPIPAITPDGVVVKRTPVINGTIERGEWDKYFSFTYEGVKVSTYVNWDDQNLYVASESSAPIDLLITLDAKNDGWFQGSDNYEFVAKKAKGTEAPTLSVSKYESQAKNTNGGIPITATEASKFTMKAASGENHVYELAIPRTSVSGLEIKPGRKIGLKVAAGTGASETTWVPTAPLGAVQQTELVNLKSSTAENSPIQVKVDMMDRRITPGEELSAKITIKNTGTSAVDIDTIVVGGEGKTAKLLGSQLVRPHTIEARKSYSFTFRSELPKTAPSGTAALGLEVRSGDQTLASSIYSFDIVQRYEARLDLTNSLVKNNGYYRIPVLVKNNTKGEVYGKIKLSLPEGWTFQKSSGDKTFFLTSEDQEQSIVFKAVPPSSVTGAVPVLAEIQIDKTQLSVSGTIK